MQKKVILVSVVVLIIGALCVGVITQEQKYKQEQARQTQARTAQQEKIEIAHKVEFNTWNARYEALKAECQKGLAAYGSLTTPIKLKTAAPNCSIGQ